MRSADDLTTRATIRNAALRLFADHGPDAASVRQIASEAGVSAALVLHHFGSKQGLRDAVDEYASQACDEIIEFGQQEDVAATLAEGDGGSIAEAFSRSFPPDSPLPAYLRRLILAGDPAGKRIFRRWYEGTRQLLDEIQRMGIAAPSDDPDVRAAFFIVSDLAVLLLRDQLRETLGFDPMSTDGMARWANEVSVIYRDGAWNTQEKP